MECCCEAAGIMLVSLFLSLALLTSPGPSCLLGPELAFPVARKAGSSPSKREDHQRLVNTETSSTADTVIGGNLEFTCTGLIGNQKINLSAFFTT